MFKVTRYYDQKGLYPLGEFTTEKSVEEAINQAWITWAPEVHPKDYNMTRGPKYFGGLLPDDTWFEVTNAEKVAA